MNRQASLKNSNPEPTTPLYNDPTSQPYNKKDHNIKLASQSYSQSQTKQQQKLKYQTLKRAQIYTKDSNNNANNSDSASRVQLNMEQIKLYISNNSQPIPDIVNQAPLSSQNKQSKLVKQSSNNKNNEEENNNIFPHFKFYFNENQLTIGRISQKQNNKFQKGHVKNNKWESVTHLEQFQEEICQLYKKWKQQIDHQQKQQQANTSKNKNDKDTKNIIHKNFITFVEYWIQKTPSLIINYTPYNELVHECCSTQYQNIISIVAYSLTSQTFSQKQKLNNKLLQKTSKNKPKTKSQLSVLAMKRLHIFFTHFTKIQNLTISSSSPSGGNTFDEINKKYNTINLQQWICFVKSFHFDQIYQQKCKRKAKQLGNKGNSKNYLPVRNVKWNSSLQYFKNLFQKFCDNAKNIDFNNFQRILKRLFQQLFAEQDKLIPISQQQKHQSPSKSQQFSHTTPSSPVSPSQSPSTSRLQFSATFITGLTHLKCLSQQSLSQSDKQFNNKLRSFGIFVSDCPTKIHVDHNDYNHYNNTGGDGASRARVKSYVKQKFMGNSLGELKDKQGKENGLMSPLKIKEGQKNSAKDIKQGILLPNVHKKEKLYTLSELMAKKQANSDLIQSKISETYPKTRQQSLHQSVSQSVHKKQVKLAQQKSLDTSPNSNKNSHLLSIKSNSATILNKNLVNPSNSLKNRQDNIRNSLSSKQNSNRSGSNLSQSSKNNNYISSINNNNKNNNKNNNTKNQSKLVSLHEQIQQHQEQQDQYLMKYYDKNHNFNKNKNKNANENQNSNQNSTYKVKNNISYNNSNINTNNDHSIIKKIDERINKIHRKML